MGTQLIKGSLNVGRAALIASSSAASLLLGLSGRAFAGTATPCSSRSDGAPTANGTITYDRGSPIDDSCYGGGSSAGFILQSASGAITISGVTLSRSAEGPQNATLSLQADSNQPLSVTFAGPGSSLTTSYANGNSAALSISENGAPITLDTSGAGDGNVFQAPTALAVAGLFGNIAPASVTIGAADRLIATQIGVSILGTDVSFTNHGSIVSSGANAYGAVIQGTSSVSIVNTGSIAGDYEALYVQGNSPATLVNTGSIQSANGSVLLGGGSLLTVVNGAAGAANTGVVLSAGGGYAFSPAGEMDITNYAGAVIQGDIPGSEKLTIDNYGVIHGTISGGLGGSNVSLYPGSVTDAVSFAGGAANPSALNLYTGSASLPPAQFGTLTDNGYATLNLYGSGDGTPTNGAAGTLSLDKVTGFQRIDKHDPGVWTFSASASTGTTAISVDQGILQVAGAGALGQGVITIGDAGGQSSILRFSLGGAGAFSNAIALSAANPTADSPIIQTDATDTVRLTGLISGANQNLAFTGGGETILDAAETYSGLTDVRAGVVTLGDSAGAGASLAGGVQVVQARPSVALASWGAIWPMPGLSRQAQVRWVCSPCSALTGKAPAADCSSP